MDEPPTWIHKKINKKSANIRGLADHFFYWTECSHMSSFKQESIPNHQVHKTKWKKGKKN